MEQGTLAANSTATVTGPSDTDHTVDANGNPVPQYGDKDVPEGTVSNPGTVSADTIGGYEYNPGTGELQVQEASPSEIEARAQKLMANNTAADMSYLKRRVELLEDIVLQLVNGSMRTHPEMFDPANALHDIVARRDSVTLTL